MSGKAFKTYLLTTTIVGAALSLSAPAYAQDASAPVGDVAAEQLAATSAAALDTAAAEVVADTAADTSADGATEEIVVTGSLFRRTSSETPSPVTVLTSESLTRRGITNVADAVRSISADSSGSVPTAFTGGFGQGAAAVSLRGLSVNSTLTIIDGLRMVNYPLADDGQRAFVDLNTIPRVAIERIEVLKDGASSTYGADAIGGVVNILMRKQYEGLEATAEAGVSQRGDGGSYRGSVLGGYGDIDGQGWNVYVGAEYERNGDIAVADRGFPYNTADLTSIGGVNGNANFLVSGGIGTAAVVRPAVQNIPGNPFSGTNVAGGVIQLLNPAACAAVGTVYDDGHGNTSCEENLSARYGTIQPEQTRWGVTGRASFQVADDSQAYLMGSFYRSEVWSGANPSSVRSPTPAPQYQNTVLPVFVCATGVNCDTAADRRLNPNNPFAADGQAARIYYRFGDIDASRRTESEVLRGAAGISGTFGEGWTYAVDLTGVRSDLNIVNEGLINIAGLTRAINTGSYNFVNPSLNSAAVRASISPTINTKATSELYLGQAVVTKELVQLQGGPLQLGVGGQIRREILDQPNQNAGQETLALNSYNANGKRTVSAAFAEISAPVLDELELQASGRFDHYSTGFSNFSPKFGVKFTPTPQLALRGTYSTGFRAPSFAETSGEVIGYTSHQPPCSFRILHGATGNATSCSGGSPYVSTYSIGYNSSSNPDLDPERSRNFTVGAVVQPARWLSFTVDYFNIKKTDVITGGPLSGQALAAYYAGGTLPAGYTITFDQPDPLFPNAPRRPVIVNAPYENASSLKTSGLDFNAALQLRLSDNVKFYSQLEATRILKYDFKPSDDSETLHLVGTQGPYIISSGAGTPAWRGSWSNTVEVGPATLTATGNYTSGYKSVAEDQNGAGANTCADALYSPAFCHTDAFFTVDLVGSYQVNDNFTFHVNVINLFDEEAPINPANYAALNYNPTYTQSGVVGRFFRAGAKIKF